MTQEESIKIWLEGSVDATDTAQKLFDSKKFNHSLFFLHLALEKLLKAIFIHKFDSAPPYTHDLIILAEKCGINISDKQKAQLSEISEFNVTARYEEYKYKMYKKATPEYTVMWFKTGLDLLGMLNKEI
ncbi:MAG: HEPN domain-containing protein [bacterium]|nr:HEPN domain-containing protein [bacterium]